MQGWKTRDNRLWNANCLLMHKMQFQRTSQNTYCTLQSINQSNAAFSVAPVGRPMNRAPVSVTARVVWQFLGCCSDWQALLSIRCIGVMNPGRPTVRLSICLSISRTVRDFYTHARFMYCRHERVRWTRDKDTSVTADAAWSSRNNLNLLCRRHHITVYYQPFMQLLQA